MRGRRPIALFLSASVAAVTLPAAANADGSAFVGGLIGSVIGNAIANQPQQKRTYVRRSTSKKRSGISSAQRAENREVQTSLNYFGFNAGGADGVLGRNSRAAIGRYQGFMGYPSTGQLTEYERIFLTSSYNRALIGGAQNATLIAEKGMGTRGLLLAYRDEQTVGTTMAAAPAPVVPAPPAAVQQPAPVVAAAAPVPEPAPQSAPPVPAAATFAMLPNFIAEPESASTSSHCNRVTMTTNSNGGFITLASGGDPNQTLGEQFCLARSYVTDQGEALAASVQGFTRAEMQEQCEAFTPAMAGHLTRLSSQSPAEAKDGFQDFVVETGMPGAQLSANARICLGIGYGVDNADLALAATMLLVGLGEDAYGELIGHHLYHGFAVPERQDRAFEWYSFALDALDGGASPIVTDGDATRPALIRAAMGIGTDLPEVTEASATSGDVPAFAMPSFQAPEAN